MGLVIAGIIPFLFIVLVAVVNASCPAIFGGSGARFWFSALALTGALAIAAGVLARRGSRLAAILGRAPAGLASGLLVQPGSSIVFAVAIAVATVASPRGPLADRIAGGVLLGVSIVVGYTFAFSPLVLGPPARC